MRRLVLCGILGSLLLSGQALADQPAAAPPNPAPASSKTADLIAQGDAAAVARNFDAAIQAYRSALAGAPEDPATHYRLGQALTMKGDLVEAEHAYEAAVRFAEKDPVLRGKAVFCMADVRERQKAYDPATETWVAYESHAQAFPAAKVHPKTAVERKQRIAAWQKAMADAAEVKARIDRREREGDETRRSNSK